MSFKKHLEKYKSMKKKKLSMIALLSNHGNALRITGQEKGKRYSRSRKSLKSTLDEEMH